ncbi:MAG: ketopantoate reductase family protein [Bacillota bacterium]|nr:ketopantoate reductase family protein [Bacillota bacterium]
MKKIMFLGMGAIGGAFASQLTDGGIKPIVVCNENRKKRYERNGFIINKKRYDFEYFLPSKTNYKAEIIFIAVKYQDLKESLNLINNFIGKNTIIVSLMNGIDSEMIIGNKYGKNHIVHAFVIGIDAVKNNNILNFNSNGQIIFGKENGIENNQTTFIKNLFDQTNINYKLSNEILKELWWKFMVNVGINQVSSIINAPYGIFTKCNEASDLMKLAMREVISLSIEMNINLDESAIDKFDIVLNNLAPEGITSMLQDVKAKRKTEVEMLSGQVIEFGKKYNIPTPINEFLFKMIKSIEFINNIN